MTWEERVRHCIPYTPGEQPDDPEKIKLNTYENPYPPSPRVLEALRAFDAEDLRLYPDPLHRSLNRALAERYGVTESRIFTGVGSDDVLSMAFLALFHSDDPVLFPDITYSFYDVWARIYGIPYRTVPLDDNFRIRIEDYTGKTAAGGPADRGDGAANCGGIVFPNPNAPTGEAMPLSAVEEIVRANPGCAVIVDEAYVDFGTESAVRLTDRYENLLVVQTFSKARSLTGLRIGFAIGSEKMIRCLNDVKYSVNSYTLNRLALTLGCAVVEDEAYFQEQLGKIVSTRERSKKELAALGFEMTDSRSNFLFVRHPKKDAKEIFDRLRERHIYVRWFDLPRIRQHLRITVGTDSQMDTLFDTLREVLA